MSDLTSYGARAPQPNRSEVTLHGPVVMITDRGHKIGTVARMPHPDDQNEMLSVLFENEDFPREVRLRSVHAVASRVTISDSGSCVVTFYATGVATNGTPGDLSVLLVGDGDCSLVCDGSPCGGGNDIVPGDLMAAARRGGVGAERTALFALNALCGTQSSIFADHALSREALRTFVAARLDELTRSGN